LQGNRGVAKSTKEGDGEPENDGGGAFHCAGFFVAGNRSGNDQLGGNQ
jgi:hypothetical protein